MDDLTPTFYRTRAGEEAQVIRYFHSGRRGCGQVPFMLTALLQLTSVPKVSGYARKTKWNLGCRGLQVLQIQMSAQKFKPCGHA